MFQYLCRPLHSKTGQWHTLSIYIFKIPHQFQINMQDFRSPTWFAYFRWRVFWVRVELIFAMKFCLNFWGDARKIAIEGSIIDLDPYIIPHFEGNMPHYVANYSLHYLNAYVWRGNRLNGPKPTNWQSDFLKNRPDTFAPPPYPEKLGSDGYKTTIV